MKRALLASGAVLASLTLLVLGNLLLLGQPGPPVILAVPAFDPYTFQLGLLLWVLYAGTLAVGLRLAITLRPNAVLPPPVLLGLRDAARRGDGRDARMLCRTSTSPLARVVAAGLARLPLGPESAREAAYQMTLTIKAEQQRQLVYLELLALLGSAIGLLAFCHAVRLLP